MKCCYRFQPKFEIARQTNGLASIAALEKEQGVYSASPRFIQDNCMGIHNMTKEERQHRIRYAENQFEIYKLRAMHAYAQGLLLAWADARHKLGGFVNRKSEKKSDDVMSDNEREYQDKNRESI